VSFDLWITRPPSTFHERVISNTWARTPDLIRTSSIGGLVYPDILTEYWRAWRWNCRRKVAPQCGFFDTSGPSCPCEALAQRGINRMTYRSCENRGLQNVGWWDGLTVFASMQSSFRKKIVGDRLFARICAEHFMVQ